MREHEHAPSREAILDYDALPALAPEARISRLAHWVCLAELQRRPYELRLPGQRLGPALGAEHRHACLTALALL